MLGGMAKRVKLSVTAAAEMAGIRPATWRAYVNRGAAPAPDGREEISSTPWWYAETVLDWMASRPGTPGRPKSR
jgi:hypothetical protein